MKQKNLYLIGGCNGAGKTTASFDLLPEILGCKEFVNADEIARGISPFQPETVSFEAGRIMLERIQDLLSQGSDFAFETTLATKSFKNLINQAKNLGYTVTLLYFWLESYELAIARVKTRVSEGGHNIPEEIVKRRYFAGITNLFKIYHDLCDMVVVYDNSRRLPDLIYERSTNNEAVLHNQPKYELVKSCVL